MEEKYTLTSGRGVTIDLSKITLKEWRALFDGSQPEAAGDEIIGKITGLTPEEVLDLPILDWKGLIAAILKKYRDPLQTP